MNSTELEDKIPIDPNTIKKLTIQSTNNRKKRKQLDKTLQLIAQIENEDIPQMFDAGSDTKYEGFLNHSPSKDREEKVVEDILIKTPLNISSKLMKPVRKKPQ